MLALICILIAGHFRCLIVVLAIILFMRRSVGVFSSPMLLLFEILVFRVLVLVVI